VLPQKNIRPLADVFLFIHFTSHYCYDLYFCDMDLFFNNTSPRPWESQDEDVMVETTTPYQLIVWNDEVNTFEWVIETLMEVCGHSHEQAEQSALIIHFQGKYAVKKGDYDTLKPMCDAITDRGIGATIENIQ